MLDWMMPIFKVQQVVLLTNRIDIDAFIVLDQITSDDAFDLVEQINHTEIAKNTLYIPFPYRLSDATLWINGVSEKREQLGYPTNWTIRYGGKLVGGIGLQHSDPRSDKDEVGYWLGPDCWGKGIMTRVLNGFVSEVFNKSKIEILEAPVFIQNYASQRVLEKCGFEKIKIVKNAYEKDGRLVDAILYSIHG